MTNDDPFRFILIVGLVVVLPIAVVYRLRSHTSERLDRRQEGLFILIALRLCGILGMIGLIAFTLDPRWMAWSSVDVPRRRSMAGRWNRLLRRRPADLDVQASRA